MKQVFLLGAYGQRNLGDDALLEIFLQQFNGERVVVNSARPVETTRRYGVDCVATYVGWPKFKRLRVLWASDVIVFGGGSLLKEIEGNTVARLLYFARILAILLFSRLLGRTTMMIGVGIGPLTQPVYCWLSCIAANLTDMIYVRDTASRELLRAIGVRKHIDVAADPVFLLENNVQPVPHAGLLPAPAEPRSVIVVPRYSLTSRQQAALATACDDLVALHKTQIIFLPFQTGYRAKFDDVTVANAIRSQMHHATSAEVRVLDSPSDALKVIEMADLVISMRLHGLIFAAIQCVPAIALSYEVKVRSFMAESGQSEACLSLRDLEDGKLTANIEQIWRTRVEMMGRVQGTTQELRDQAQRMFDHAHALVTQRRVTHLLPIR